LVYVRCLIIFGTLLKCILNIMIVTSSVTQETRYAQRAQTSAEHGNPEDPDFGLWTPGSEA